MRSLTAVTTSRIASSEATLSSKRYLHSNPRESDFRPAMFHGERRQYVHRRSSETGAVLILAMIFLVVISIAILSVSSWTQNSLNNTLKFQNITQRLYAAEGVTQLAIRASRYTYLNGVPGASATSYICPGTSSPVELDNYAIQDLCSTQIFDSGTLSRQITITACLMPSTSTQLTPNPSGNCLIGTTPVQSLLTVGLKVDDVTSPNESPLPCTSVSNEYTCGANMIIYSWSAT
jgi:hypothetical protein